MLESKTARLMMSKFMHTVVAGSAQDAQGAESYQWNNILTISGQFAGAINAGKSPTLIASGPAV
jgi:hypothetical protein